MDRKGAHVMLDRACFGIGPAKLYIFSQINETIFVALNDICFNERWGF